MSPLVDVRRLRFRYPDGTDALRGVDFRLEAGESVVLFGANGSGKTTFLLHLNGLLRGEGGIEVCGLRLDDSTVKTIRRKVGLVFQDADDQIFLPTVLEDVAFGLLNQGHPAEEAVELARTALSRVGLENFDDRSPHHLSAGEKRRVALAGVLAMQPEVLLLDEPTISLDPPGQRELVHLLQGLPQAKVISTHDAGFARAVGARAVLFDKGRIADEGSVDELVERHEWETFPTRAHSTRG